MAYVDTNVILAKYFPHDAWHDRASSFLEYTRRRKIVSPLSAVELIAVTSRLEENLQIPRELLLESPKRRIRALVDFFIKDCGLLVESIPAQAKVRIGGRVLGLPIEYPTALGLAHALKLKTLDLMHLAYAANIRNWSHDVEFFVTADDDILSKSEIIQQAVQIEVKEPSKVL